MEPPIAGKSNGYDTVLCSCSVSSMWSLVALARSSHDAANVSCIVLLVPMEVARFGGGEGVPEIAELPRQILVKWFIL